MSKVVKEGTKNSKFASLDYEVLKYNENKFTYRKASSNKSTAF